MKTPISCSISMRIRELFPSLVKRKGLSLSGILIAGVAVPCLLHITFHAGKVLLPIYFFVLLASYKFGWKGGLTAAIALPTLSLLFSSMPPLFMLPYVLLKTFLLVSIVQVIRKISALPLHVGLVCVVVLYQALGSVAIYLLTGNSLLSLSDVQVGFPGLILQILGCYFLLRD